MTEIGHSPTRHFGAMGGGFMAQGQVFRGFGIGALCRLSAADRCRSLTVP